MEIVLFQGCEIYRNIESDTEIKNESLVFDEFIPRTPLNDNLDLSGNALTFSLCDQNDALICDINEKTKSINLSNYQNISELAKYISSL